MAGGRRGPAPKPTGRKKAEGNPGRRKLNENEPTFSPAPKDPPDWLTEVAKEEWRRVYPELASLNLISVVDRMALAGYCDNYAMVVKANQRIQQDGEVTWAVSKTGSEYPVQNPYVAIRQKAYMLMLKFAQEFGFTPSSRTRLDAPSNKDKERGNIVDMATGRG